jgi:hypothetical protein
MPAARSEVREPLEVIVDFLRSVGIDVRIDATSGVQGLPGIAVDRGVMVIDPDRLVSAGDLLHEAAHLAVMSPARRRAACGRFDSSQAEEMTAFAWSHAAALHLGLDPALVFHEHGYGERGGAWVVDAYSRGATPGVPGLCWLGLTSHDCAGQAIPGAVYPIMIAWLNETDKELR